MLYAHYFKTKQQHIVIISDSMKPVGQQHIVQGKKEAKLLALKLNAKRWNY